MTEQDAILDDVNYIPVGEFGFVGLVDRLGDDSTPPQRARTSYGKGTKSVSDDRNLLRYLIRHKHTTPVEMVQLVFHLKMPIFVMRQHVRHRMSSMNEYSARYSEMSDEFYTPLTEDIALQSTTNKQGREHSDLIELQDKLKIQEIMGESYAKSYEAYKELLDMGLARELSRSVLPVANMTECFWSIDLHNFFHYIKLRKHKHAQKEIRDFAEAMFELVQRVLPLSCEAFNDYIFEAVTFSRLEMQFMKDHVIWNELQDTTDTLDPDAVCQKYGFTKREWEEFRAKINA